ncbi:MAG: transcriptional regulator GcvA [Proteobacteria bacterium]|nr:transcriptional regulator GcvA [Pseudomonadota bacterium]
MARINQLPPSGGALRAFDAAARNLSFTDAAAELNQTQGAISHQIKELELRLGVKLFRRGPRGISLTESGATYLPYVREALDRLRAGADALRHEGDDNMLTISCSPNFAAKWLVPRLGTFSREHPDIDLRISASMQHVTFDNDGIDLAVRHGEGDWPHLHVTQLCKEEIFPICSPHLLRSRNQVDGVGGLAEFGLLHDQDRAGWTKWLTAMGAPLEKFELDHGPVFSDASLVMDAAVAGQGIALARSALAALNLRAGSLVRPVRDAMAAQFAYWIVCPKPRAQRPQISGFRQWLVAQATAERDSRPDELAVGD